jgi:hypothetical protein
MSHIQNSVSLALNQLSSILMHFFQMNCGFPGFVFMQELDTNTAVLCYNTLFLLVEATLD